jgi:8-oxo-dGTP pyrophosphatase MutT (NUDIX family)
MPISQYLREIRRKVGTDLLLMPSVSAIVWNEERRVLLLRQYAGGPWTLPGGIVDPGEFPAQAVVREVREETGVSVRPEGILGVFGGPEGFRRTYPNGDQVEFVDILFECRAIGGSLECLDGEAVEASYFSTDEVARLVFSFPVDIMVLLQTPSTPMFHWDEKWLA